MIVPLAGQKVESIPKELAIEFNKFVYLDCYGDIYETTDPHYAKYRQYLFDRIREYEDTLPDHVEVE